MKTFLFHIGRTSVVMAAVLALVACSARRMYVGNSNNQSNTGCAQSLASTQFLPKNMTNGNVLTSVAPNTAVTWEVIAPPACATQLEMQRLDANGQPRVGISPVSFISNAFIQETYANSGPVQEKIRVSMSNGTSVVIVGYLQVEAGAQQTALTCSVAASPSMIDVPVSGGNVTQAPTIQFNIITNRAARVISPVTLIEDPSRLAVSTSLPTPSGIQHNVLAAVERAGTSNIRFRVAAENPSAEVDCTPVAVHLNPVQSVPAPVVSVSANGITGQLEVPPNGQIELNWSTSYADSCTVTGGFTGTSGSQFLVVSQSTVYTVECTGPGGEESGTVNVVVNPILPAQSTVACTATAIPSPILVPVLPGLPPPPGPFQIRIDATVPAKIVRVIPFPVPGKPGAVPLILPSIPVFPSTQHVLPAYAVELYRHGATFVLQASYPNTLTSCVVLWDMLPGYPMTGVSLKANGVEGEIDRPASGNVVLDWSSQNANSCVFNVINASGSKTQLGSGLTGSHTVAASSIQRPTTYELLCQGAGGEARATALVKVDCDTNQLRTSLDRVLRVFDLPIPPAPGGTLPRGASQSGDFLNKTAFKNLLTNLVAGQRIKVSDLAGVLIKRVHAGIIYGYGECPSAGYFQFSNNSDIRIDPAGFADGMVPISQFQGATGFPVPAGATKLWAGTVDPAYWDNDSYDVSRVPYSNGTMTGDPLGRRVAPGGCHFDLAVNGCQ